MNKITSRQIDQLVNNATANLTETLHQDYLEAIESLPEDVKNNTLAHCEVALAMAQRNNSAILKYVLTKLLVE